MREVRYVAYAQECEVPTMMELFLGAALFLGVCAAIGYAIGEALRKAIVRIWPEVE